MRLERRQSAQLFEEAKSLFPGGVHSPVRAFKAVDGPPIFFQRAKDTTIWDEDGNEFTDFCCSWGPLILGHADQRVVDFASEKMQDGLSFGAPSKMGNELGKLIIDNHRHLDKLRFVSSGTEAVMSAVRLARGFTGRDLILKFEGCYHGHVDSLLVKAGSGLATFGISSSAGVPESFVDKTVVCTLNDEAGAKDAFEKYGKDIAAVIIEPIPANNGLLLQEEGFLRLLRDLCSRHESLLIFDEVISGFRVGFEGAAGHYDIKPDLLTYGKIIGGGMPVGAYGGRADVMSSVAPEGPVYQAGTLSANPVTMAAGLKTLQILLEENPYEALAKKTSYLAARLDENLKSRGWGIQHIGSIFWIKFTDQDVRTADDISPESTAAFSKLYSHLLERKIYFGPSAYEVGFMNTKHEEKDLNKLAEAILSFEDV